jgi:ADP-ribose pyrophosphatase YjhB (NUDIX family)
MKRNIQCPKCGEDIEAYKNPVPTVDIIIRFEGKGIILIRRKNPPYGWALPGGFIDYGESAEEAARREAQEETNITVKDLRQFKVYSAPDRDPRRHTITVVFTAKGQGEPRALDDAAELALFKKEELPEDIAFDHGHIISDYFSSME